VFTTGAQKLFLLLQDALSDAPCDVVAKTYSLRTEVDVRCDAIAFTSLHIHSHFLSRAQDVFRSGVRIARCMAETYLQCGRLSGAAHALSLARTAELRLWDASKLICRQFDGIGKVHAAALAAGGYTRLDDVDAADPRRLEAVTGRTYLFGAALQAACARTPRIEMTLDPVGGSAVPKRGDTMEFIVRLRSAPAAAAAAAAAAGAPAPSSSSRRGSRGNTTPGVLICGTRQDDALLHWQRMAVCPAEGWTASARFTAIVPQEGPMQVVAGVVFESVCGRDVTKHWSWTPPGGASSAGGAGRAPLPLAPAQPGGAAGGKRAAGTAAAEEQPGAGKRPTIRSSFEFVAAKNSALPPSRDILAAASAAGGGGGGASAAPAARSRKAPRPPIFAVSQSDEEDEEDDTPLPAVLPPPRSKPAARIPSPPAQPPPPQQQQQQAAPAPAPAAPTGFFRADGAVTPQLASDAAAASPSRSDTTAAASGSGGAGGVCATTTTFYDDIFEGLF
jgi:hypothetical protein